jgi:hypothetical protein
MGKARKMCAAKVAKILKGNEILENQKNFVLIMNTLQGAPELALRLLNILVPAPQLHTQCL